MLGVSIGATGVGMIIVRIAAAQDPQQQRFWMALAVALYVLLCLADLVSVCFRTTLQHAIQTKHHSVAMLSILCRVVFIIQVLRYCVWFPINRGSCDTQDKATPGVKGKKVVRQP
jgi:hypothetical protein